MKLNVRKMRKGHYQIESPTGEKIENLKVDRVLQVNGETQVRSFVVVPFGDVLHEKPAAVPAEKKGKESK